MGWGKEWPTADNDSTFTIAEDILKHDSGITPELLGVDWAKGPDQTVYYETNGIKVKQLTEEEFKKKYNNSMPTHDPYTNPDATIYYECGCGAILDPNTKSFAALNNHASDKGWKIRFTDNGYEPYCVKCGEGVE